MKVEIDVLDDQLDLLNRIKRLPAMIQSQIGLFPQCFARPDCEMDMIVQAVANLEFKCKKMIFETCIVKEQLASIFDDVELDSSKYRDRSEF